MDDENFIEASDQILVGGLVDFKEVISACENKVPLLENSCRIPLLPEHTQKECNSTFRIAICTHLNVVGHAILVTSVEYYEN